MNHHPGVVAHRGFSGNAPENTIAAFRLAIDAGCDGMELDIQRLSDGTLVVFHDTDTGRITGAKGNIYDLTLAESRLLDAGSRFNSAFPEKARPEYAGLRIPTLQEVFHLAAESAVELLIEIKNPELYQPDLESDLLALTRDCRMEHRVRFLSFSAESIGKMKKLDPSARTALLASRLWRNPIKEALEAEAGELGLLHTLATPETIAAARRSGLSVSVWTVNEENDMRLMIERGADCIITNYPDRLLKILRRDHRSPGDI
ncbi:MAG TPA: glycerophosphodiester phosphodiesterase family protein [Acidobacteriota bacterium]|nr:glycerophosphodiester phosphodiesterase family protein [Acidobacteriota bacterium]